MTRRQRIVLACWSIANVAGVVYVVYHFFFQPGAHRCGDGLPPVVIRFEKPNGDTVIDMSCLPNRFGRGVRS